MSEEEKFHGRLHGPQFQPEEQDNMLIRLVFILIIAFMLSIAQTVLGAVTVVQYVIRLINGGAPNERLAEFGTGLGIWMAKAARYQTGASEVKPWPWTELD